MNNTINQQNYIQPLQSNAMTTLDGTKTPPPESTLTGATKGTKTPPPEAALSATTKGTKAPPPQITNSTVTLSAEAMELLKAEQERDGTKTPPP